MDPRIMWCFYDCCYLYDRKECRPREMKDAQKETDCRKWVRTPTCRDLTALDQPLNKVLGYLVDNKDDV